MPIYTGFIRHSNVSALKFNVYAAPQAAYYASPNILIINSLRAACKMAYTPVFISFAYCYLLCYAYLSQVVQIDYLSAHPPTNLV